MPGYKGHLGGGCVAFGVTLTACAAFTPHALAIGAGQMGWCVRALFAAMQPYIGFSQPQLQSVAHTVSHSFLPSLLAVLLWFMCALSGALFPDIDIKSKGQKWFYGFLVFLLGILVFKGKYQLVSGVALVAFSPMLVNHRGLFHRLWFVVCAPLIFWVWLSAMFAQSMSFLFAPTVFFIAGAVSHLWLDFGFNRMMRRL